jgi:hypothetical protein
MLGIAERLATDAGLDWAFCDTDSIAFAKPDEMSEAEFRRTVGDIREWFNVLNPYDEAGDLLKLEDVNFELQNGKPTGPIAPLFAFAISAKRYALFNIHPAGHPILRKASAHGLGHLMAPYGPDQTPPTGSGPDHPPQADRRRTLAARRLVSHRRSRSRRQSRSVAAFGFTWVRKARCEPIRCDDTRAVDVV